MKEPIPVLSVPPGYEKGTTQPREHYVGEKTMEDKQMSFDFKDDPIEVVVKGGYIFEFNERGVNVTEPENKQKSFAFEEQENERTAEIIEVDTEEEDVDDYEEMTYDTECAGVLLARWAKGDHDAPTSTSTPESTILLSYSHIIERELDRIKALVEQSPEVVTEEDIYALRATSGELHRVYTSLIERTKE